MKLRDDSERLSNVAQERAKEEIEMARQSAHDRPEHDVKRLPWIHPYRRSRSVDDEPVTQTTEIVEVVLVPRERISRVEQISGSFEPLIMEEIVVALLSTDRLGHHAPDPVQTASGTLKRDVGIEPSSENSGCALPVFVSAAEHPYSMLQLRHSCASHSGFQGIWCVNKEFHKKNEQM